MGFDDETLLLLPLESSPFEKPSDAKDARRDLRVEIYDSSNSNQSFDKPENVLVTDESKTTHPPSSNQLLNRSTRKGKQHYRDSSR
jgi:hypothetical protein